MLVFQVLHKNFQQEAKPTVSTTTRYADTVIEYIQKNEGLVSLAQKKYQALGDSRNDTKVIAFIDWLIINEKDLTKKIVHDLNLGLFGIAPQSEFAMDKMFQFAYSKDYKPSQLNLDMVIGFWIGAQYEYAMSDKKDKPSLPKILFDPTLKTVDPFTLISKDKLAVYDYKKAGQQLRINTNFYEEIVPSNSPYLDMMFFVGLNLGIHEASHVRILEDGTLGYYTELVPALEQPKLAIALPTRMLNILGIGARAIGNRDFYHILDEIRSGRLDLDEKALRTEYVPVVLARWLNNYYENREFILDEDKQEKARSNDNYCRIGAFYNRHRFSSLRMSGKSQAFYEYQLDYVMETLGVLDQDNDLRDKFKLVFEKIGIEKMDFMTYLDKLKNAMNEVFGKVETSTRDGFAHMYE
jgi:hypothetical protein